MRWLASSAEVRVGARLGGIRMEGSKRFELSTDPRLSLGALGGSWHSCSLVEATSSFPPANMHFKGSLTLEGPQGYCTTVHRIRRGKDVKHGAELEAQLRVHRCWKMRTVQSRARASIQAKTFGPSIADSLGHCAKNAAGLQLKGQSSSSREGGLNLVGPACFCCG